MVSDMKTQPPQSMRNSVSFEAPSLSRRQFLTTSALFAAAAVTPGCKTWEGTGGREPIIDIHQHVGYSGRSDEALFAHQQTMGVTKTILLPAGRPVYSALNYYGVSNGLK